MISPSENQSFIHRFVRRVAIWFAVAAALLYALMFVRTAGALADVPEGTEATKALTYGQASEIAQEASLFLAGAIAVALAIWLAWQVLRP